jgi:hypothetical protein
MTARSNRPHAAAIAAVVGFVWLGGDVPLSRAAEAPLVVVVAATSLLADLSRGDLRRAYLGEPTSGPGGRLIPLNQVPGTSVRTQFDRVVLGLEPDAVARWWIDQRIRGLGGAPRSIPAGVLGRLLPRLSGTIGYLRATEVGPGLKVVTIDGKKPGDPGYLLQ